MDQKQGKRIIRIQLRLLETNIYLDKLKRTLKYYQIGKHQVMISFINSGFKKVMSLNDWLALHLSKCQQEANIPECMTKVKITWNRPEQHTTKAPNCKTPGHDCIHGFGFRKSINDIPAFELRIKYTRLKTIHF